VIIGVGEFRDDPELRDLAVELNEIVQLS